MKAETPALMDLIVDWAKSGKVRSPFCTADIRELAVAAGHTENHISTVLANYAEDTGDQVKRGRQPRFRRVGRGLYEVLT